MTSTEEHISLNIKTFESLTKKQQQLQKRCLLSKSYLYLKLKIDFLFKIKNQFLINNKKYPGFLDVNYIRGL